MKRREFQSLISKGLLAFNIALPKIPYPKFNQSFLKRGDKIALIAPGSPVTFSQLEHSIQNVKRLGLRPIFNENGILTKTGFLAGNDERRVNEIHSYLKQKEVKALWAVRGGYGCTRILPLLDRELVASANIPIIGYSDVTALLCYWDQNTKCTSFHGPVLKEDWSLKTLRNIADVLFKGADQDLKTDPSIFPEITGHMIGGNLTVLSALAGTKYFWNIRDKIIFFEDVGEKPYRIDRMLNQINQASPLNQAKAVVLGQFTDCEAPSNSYSYSLQKTLELFFEQIKIPVLTGLNIGHIPDQVMIPVNQKVRLNPNKLEIIFD
jgi:muramoyltetrapeptide carboxypeptidase